MRIHTCTPVDFRGDQSFFSRESGLLSRGLAESGHESMAIMPGPPRADDLEGLIRTPYRNLEDPAWWGSLGLDGLVLYSWALPKFNPVVEAVRRASIPVLVNMDTNGLMSRFASPANWRREGYPFIYQLRGGLKGLPLSLPLMLRERFTRIKPRQRFPHYQAATRIAAVTPSAKLWIARETASLGGQALAEKVVYLPHPQSERFRYDQGRKENLIVSVARWQAADWPQKRPRILLASCDRFLKERPDWKVVIVGSGATRLADSLKWPADRLDERISFVEHMAPADLSTLFNRAKIGFWTSQNEGQQGTAAQALCCGCSVVSHHSALMNCFQHYVSRDSGRLAGANDPELLADALLLEAEAWESGQRDPARISASWCPEFHSRSVADRVLQALGLDASPAKAALLSKPQSPGS